MKILQLPKEFAGQVNLTAQGLRAIGHEAYNASKPISFGFPNDINIRFKFPGLQGITNPFLFFDWCQHFDIFHYHKSPFWPKGYDINYLVKKNKKFFIEFWGSDIRLHELEKARNPFFVSDNATNQQRKLDRLKFWSDHTDQVIMSDNSADIFLKPYFGKIHIVRQRINTSAYQPVYPDPENRTPKIMHAPSVKSTKGTEYIEKALDNLRNKGVQFEYILVHGLSHTEAMKQYSQADIIVDQLLMGSHGVFAVEAMALGKPVITYIHDELLPTYPDGFPIVNANPNTIEQALERLITSPGERHSIGKQGRLYAEQVHDYREVARRLQKIYEQS